MNRRPLRTLAAVGGSLLAIGTTVTGSAAGPSTNWDQWGQNPQHQGFVSVTGQALTSELANIVYDPFVPAEQADAGGDLLAHYQATILHEEDAYMMFKTGFYTADSGANTATHWNSQVWNERRLHWENGELVTKWNFASDWKPEPADLAAWEPVFHPALAGEFLYVPGANGTVHKLNTADGSLAATIDPGYPAIAGSTVYVAGPLSADDGGNIIFNALQLNYDPNKPTAGDESALNSWVVKISPTGTTGKVSFASLVPNAPTSCVGAFGLSRLPWPGVATSGDSTSAYDPNYVRPLAACGAQRPGLNVAPAVAPDGTIYTVSRADFNSRYSYLVAVNPDLTPKWAASLRDRGINDGCGVLIPIATRDDPVQKGKCRWGTYGNHLGVDPQTNQMPAGRVIDQSSSSPVVLPDGNVLYGAYSRYNVSRGHMFKFDNNGQFLSYYDFGWDSTPAVWSHDGTYSVVIKDNHYDEEEGYYCNQNSAFPVSQTVCAFTGIPAGPFYITQLSGSRQDQPNHRMASEWKFKSTNQQSCSRDAAGQVTCVTDGQHPNGFEWCINAPAVDATGTVYNNSEDGRLYALPQGHSGVWQDGSSGPAATHFFTNLALGAAYTPLSVDKFGRIFTQNDGHLFVVGVNGHPGTGANGPQRQSTGTRLSSLEASA